jgi:hypothetical protein
MDAKIDNMVPGYVEAMEAVIESQAEVVDNPRVEHNLKFACDGIVGDGCYVIKDEGSVECVGVDRYAGDTDQQ